MVQPSNQKKQVWFLTLWSLAFLLPIYWVKGTNCVTITYWEGSERFWQGLNPYAPPIRSDVFHYSPFFAFIYYPLTLLPGFLHASILAFINIFVFWKGMSLWFVLNWKQTPIVLFALICAAMELDITMRYQQCNAMMAGFILISLDYLRKETSKTSWYAGPSGLFYALAVNFKIFPVVFGLPLLKRRKTLVGVGAFLLLLAIIPGIYAGPQGIVKLHKQQFESIQEDTAIRKMSDLRPSFERRNMPKFGEFAHYIVLTFFFLYCLRLLFSRSTIPLDLYYSLTSISLLLLSPRTESPTFIMAAPAYVFMALSLPKWLYPPLAFGMFITTFVFTAAWDPFFHLEIQNGFFSKTLGTLILWVVCAIQIIRLEFQQQSALSRLNSATLPT